MSSVPYGKANYESGGQFEKVVYHQLGHKQESDRVLIVRIAPPIKSFAEKGIWARYIKTHWGYGIRYTNSKTGETKKIPKTFLCIERVDREGAITQECPECKETRAIKADVDERQKKYASEGKTPEEIESLLRSKKGYLKDHNQDRKWHMLAKDLNGKWGYLKISHTCKQLLDAQIKKLIEKGIDPLCSDKGVYFRFERTGTTWNTIKDTPEVHRDAEDKIKYDQLTDGDWGQLEKLQELAILGTPLTYDQIQHLVRSGGDEETVRMVMNLPQKSAEPEVVTGESLVEEDVDPAPAKVAAAPVQAVAAPAPAVVAVPAPVVSAEDQEIAKLQAMLAAAQAKKAQPAPSSSPKLEAALKMPMADFLKQFEK
jgi:hypothetical protein